MLQDNPRFRLRVGEALGLKWKDIDLPGRTLVVHRALRRQTRRGLVFVAPKAKLSRRTVQLGSLACAGLRTLDDQRELDSRKRKIKRTGDELVFATESDRPLDRGRVHLNWKAALKRASLPPVRLHDLRHTAATLMLLQDVHPKVVQEVLGHSSIAMTLDTYSHVEPTMHREAADRVDALLQGAEP